MGGDATSLIAVRALDVMSDVDASARSEEPRSLRPGLTPGRRCASRPGPTWLLSWLVVPLPTLRVGCRGWPLAHGCQPVAALGVKPPFGR